MHFMGVAMVRFLQYQSSYSARKHKYQVSSRYLNLSTYLTYLLTNLLLTYLFLLKLSLTRTDGKTDKQSEFNSVRHPNHFYIQGCFILCNMYRHLYQIGFGRLGIDQGLQQHSSLFHCNNNKKKLFLWNMQKNKCGNRNRWFGRS